MNDLQIYELSEILIRLLKGERQAIADLKLLLKKHNDMFESLCELNNVITETLLDPDIITHAKRESALLVAKILSNNKMGEIAIENDNGTNVIFHANHKRIKEFHRLASSLVEAPTLSTHRSKSAGELARLPGTDVRLATTGENLPYLSQKVKPKRHK